MKTLSIFAMLALLSTYSFAAELKTLPEVDGNLSGITYSPDSDSYFLIQNNSGNVFEYKADFTRPLRVIHLQNLIDDDTEDIAYLGNNEFALSTESNQVLILKILPGQTSIDARESRAEVQLMQLPRPGKSNKGLEGVCYSKKQNLLFAVQEKKPKRIFQWPRPATMEDITSPDRLRLREPYDADALLKHVMSDLSACHYDDAKDELVLLSHESSRVMRVNLQGQAVSTLDLPKEAPQYEGLTFGKNGEMVLVSEPNIVVIIK
ncbi:SdiA-regulated domain-containing protein [Bdellovibrio bacteriovorus]|uniref:SdiA-regulated domain-containing protein n=1 Tax=Bdellovibrio bacteriovorus TaxID=959 RepID=UPI0021D342FD|nr:SdiA-regulated domain-containing protein [Bdellovibrio bacteriovorus]UXR64724.1 SdiA-regulated domain-containing protein [Bdellovibrio bacteriovorus]